jgi:hypothetical protein
MSEGVVGAQCLSESWVTMAGESWGDAGRRWPKPVTGQLRRGGELRRVHTPGATTGPIAIHAGFLNTSETLASTTTDDSHPPTAHIARSSTPNPRHRNTAIPLRPSHKHLRCPLQMDARLPRP